MILSIILKLIVSFHILGHLESVEADILLCLKANAV